MPKGSEWYYGFAGEYPWATPFNTEPDEWYSRGRRSDNLPQTYIPSFSSLGAEWEIDASLPRYFHMRVPARAFYSLGDLWWDGRDGFRIIGGRTVFRDP